ncbi:MAG: TonB-dependent receptor [Pseudomonadales bacterium]|nr:TonB-dependent receptor [Pseudomonadales bacterium]
MAHQLFRSATLSLIAATCPLTTMAQERYPVLEEIIVTAQKRSQSLQDVPIAITAISQEMLENQNIYDVLDLQKAVPSLTIVQGYNRANGVPMIIRGMGTLGAQPAFEGSVGTYVDGVYRSRPGMVLSSMLDIGQVEVLRGPQGTLFGKNTTAGAITMASNQPAPEFGYGGEVTLGDYDRQRFTGHVTGPISDAVLARLAVLSDQRNGFTDAVYQHDDYGDLDTQAIKGSLLWKANDDVDIKLIADYSDSNEVCCFGNPVPFNRAMSLTGGPFNDYYREAAQANFDTTKDLLALDPDDRETQNNVQPSNDNTDQGLAVDINWNLGFAELRSISGYRNWKYNSKGDFDFGPVDIGTLEEDYKVDTYSQEFNLNGSIGALGFLKELQYVAGLYYAYEDFEQYRAFDAGHDQAGIWELFWPVQAGVPEPVLRGLLGGGTWATTGEPIGKVRHTLKTETLAAFTHLTAALNERSSIILGVRYSDEEKTLDRHNLLFSDVADYSAYMQEFMLGGYMLGANIAGPDINNQTYSDGEWTYDIKFQYFASPDTQLYGGYSRGFKAGGIGMDPEAGGGQPSGLNSPLLLALAGMGNGTGYADLEDPTYKPEYVDTWEVGLKSQYLDGRGRTNVALFYNDIEDIQFSVFSGTGFTVLNASNADVSGVELENFFALTPNLRLGMSVTWLDTQYGDDIPPPAEGGRELTLAPDWAGALSMEYERPLTNSLAGFINANGAYRGDQHLAYDIQDKLDDYTVLGMQLGVRSLDNGWDIRAWCSNCLDETYATAYFNAPFYFDDNLEQYQGQFLGPPRTYGVTLRANF